MKEASLTKMVILGLIPGMIAGVVINNMTATETTKSYVADISILTTVLLRMVKMIAAPLIIPTLVVGVTRMDDAKTLGRILSKTFFLFICTSLVSIVLGLVIISILQPSTGISFVPHDVGAVATVKSEPFTLKILISHAVPTSIVDAVARSEILQIAVFPIFLGCSFAAIGEKADPTVKVLNLPIYVMLKLTGYVMLLASLTVFAVISGLIAEYGLGVMVSAGIFMGEFYLMLGILWAILIGLFMMTVGLYITRLTKSILELALLAFTTSGLEVAFPGTLDKLERFGVSLEITSFVLPIGCFFNLVNSMACCSFATVFIARACNIGLSMGEQITMLLILILTSKKMASAPRVSVMVIVATLNQSNIPEAGLILLMGVDLFFDMGRSAMDVTNNAMGAAIVSRWKGGYFGQGCRGSVPVKPLEQERPATKTEVVLS